MATIKMCTNISQSKVLAEFLPLESADMYYASGDEYDICFGSGVYEKIADWLSDGTPKPADIPCWSLAALYAILPEINGVSLKIEKVKAEDGYEGYYYPIEYEGIVLIPYSKNPVDACYEMIIKLKELNLL